VTAARTTGGATVSARLKRSVVEHYEARLAEHGPNARGMDWKDEASQRLRFAILCGVTDLPGRSVHEVGCGAGHLVDFLRAESIAAEYSGSDLSAAMVAAARAAHPGVAFEQRDVLVESAGGPYDVVLCSGLFHVKVDNDDDAWWSFVTAMLHRMFDACRVAIAFNLMSDAVDYRAPGLFYADAGRTLDFCRRELSRFVTLRHDYPLYEYTVSVHRQPLR
jgi:SAM-dependent methyltransferase